MEPPKRRRSQRLQQPAAAEDDGSHGPQSAPGPAAAAELAKKLRPGPDAAAAAPADGSTCSTFAHILLPELLQRVAGFMERNEVACSLRLVCTAAAAALPGPRYTTVRLSEPSPTAAFALQWSGPDALRSLTRKQREQLERLTARSGSIANLQTLAARGDLPLLSRQPQDWGPLLGPAARGGRLEMCAWLRQQGTRVLGPVAKVAEAAAESGDVAAVELLLVGTSSERDMLDSACFAAHHGRVQLMDWLLDRLQPNEYHLRCLLPGAAHGCTLHVLQRLHARFLAVRRQLEVADLFFEDMVSCVVGSPTPDWQAKVEWLEALGCPRTRRECAEAARQPDALARLQWLAGRGYHLGAYTAEVAALAGSAEALQYVLAQGVALGGDAGGLMLRAAQRGHLAVAQVLHAAGAAITPAVVEAAAEGGHLPTVEWAAAQLGAGLELTARLFCAAVRSGSWPLLRWLHEHGCAWDASVFATAACSCSEEQLEWLVARGCPMGADGALYVVAVSAGDLFVLRCLRRLGYPFAADGSTFTAAVRDVGLGGFKAPFLWLLDAGCPVDWGAALRVARSRGCGWAHVWLQEQWQQRSRTWGGRLRSASGGQGSSGPSRR